MSCEYSKPSIIIVDDEDKLSNFLFITLQKLNYRVMVCNSVAQARQILLVTPFHLLLSDIIMPTENGFSLARWVKQHYPAMPIVLMTAHATESVMLRAIQVGVADVLEKPFSIDSLEETINRLVPAGTPLPEQPFGNSLGAYPSQYSSPALMASQFEVLA